MSSIEGTSAEESAKTLEYFWNDDVAPVLLEFVRYDLNTKD